MQIPTLPALQIAQSRHTDDQAMDQDHRWGNVNENLHLAFEYYIRKILSGAREICVEARGAKTIGLRDFNTCLRLQELWAPK